MQKNSTSPKTTESAKRFSELSDIHTTEEYLKSYQTVTQLVNNPDQASISTGLSHGSSSNNNNIIDNATNKHPPNHKPPSIVINNCENLNGLIRSIDKIVHPSKYSVKCHSNNSVSILAADSAAYRAISKDLIAKRSRSTPGSLKRTDLIAWLFEVFITPLWTNTLKKPLPCLAILFVSSIDQKAVSTKQSSST